jgi:hypothetical protein
MSAQELESILSQVERLSPDEQLELMKRITDILDKSSKLEAEPSTRRHSIDLLEELAGRRLFKTPAEADEYLREERGSWDR